MARNCVIAVLLGMALMSSFVSADDDSYEIDSDEWFGNRHRAAPVVPVRNTWGSSSASSWRRHDDSDESDERWGGRNRWVQPARPAAVWNGGSAGRPLQTTSNPWVQNNNRWNNNNQWSSNANSVWSNSGSNRWAPRQNTANKWNKWNAGKQSTSSNSGKWRNNNNNSWNRRWW